MLLINITSTLEAYEIVSDLRIGPEADFCHLCSVLNIRSTVVRCSTTTSWFLTSQSTGAG
jgi:hypothetical protein